MNPAWRLAHTDDGRRVVFYRWIVCPESCSFGECRTVARDICSLRPDKANEVVDCARFVIRDLKKEGSDGLSDSCKVGVWRLSDDRIKVVKGMCEFCHNLLRRHSASEMAQLSSWGSGAAVFEVLRKHRVTVTTTYTENHHRRFGLGGYFMAAVLAATSYSRIGFSICLAVHARRLRVPGGSEFHLEPGTIGMSSSKVYLSKEYILMIKCS